MTTATTTTRRRPVTASSPASSDASTAATAPSTAEGGTDKTDAARSALAEAPTLETGTTESGQVFQSEGADSGAPAADAGTEAPAGDAPPVTDDAPSAQEPETDDDVDARVLIAFDGYEANDIVTAPRSVIGKLYRAGQVDPHPDAVAFALAQQG